MTQFQEIMRDIQGYLKKSEIEKVIQLESKERNRMLMEILWNTGARLEEIIGGNLKRTKDIKDEMGNIIKKETFFVRCEGLTVNNIEKDSLVLIIPWLKKRTKHISYRRVPITDKCMDKLLLYIKENNIGKKERVFPIGRTTAWRIISRAGRRAGFDSIGITGKGLHPHHFRHSLAIHLTENGMDISKISQILGHSSISATGFYLRFKTSVVEEDYHRIMESDGVND